MEFVRQIARKVTVLHQGSVLCEGSIEEVQNDPQVIEVYLGSQPSITPHQMKLLRVVASMAWADGSVSHEEAELILSHFCELFSDDATQKAELRQELQNYLLQNVPVDELITQIEDPEERQLVMKLGYDVIGASARSPDEAYINEEEAQAYQRLAELFGLPVAAVERLEVQQKGEG